MLKKIWRAIWAFFNPAPLEDKRSVDLVGGNVYVELTRGWVRAGLIKQNWHTCWVKLWDGHIIKRRNRKVKV